MKPRQLRLTCCIGTILMLLVVFSTGCWNRREIENLNFVLAAGIDETKQGYLLSSQVVNTPAMTKEGAGGGPTFFTFTSAGQTVFDAIRKTTHSSPNRLFWAHTKVLVLSESVANKGILPSLEFFTRDAEERRSFLLVITPDSAEKIISADVKMQKIPALTLVELLDGYRATSTTMKTSLNDFLRIYHTTESAIIPTVRLTPDQGVRGDAGYYVSRSAVFKKDKLVSYFTPIETRGVLWVKGEVKSSILVGKCPRTESNQAKDRMSFEVLNASSDVQAEQQQGQFVIRVKIKENGNIAEGSCIQNETDPQVIAELEKLKKEKIRSEVEAALNKAQKLKVDVFGFGEVIHRTYPEEWKKIERNWEDIFASSLKVKIEVESKITGNALIQRKK